MIRYRNKYISYFLFILWGVFTVNAQEISWAPGTVRKIHIECTGAKHLTNTFILNHIGIQEGNSCDQTCVDNATKQLYKTGWFQQVELVKENEQEGSFDMRVRLQVFSKVRKISFQGNNHFSDNTLLNEIKCRNNRALDEQQLQDDCQRLVSFYETKGYCDAQIGVMHSPLKIDDYEDVTFIVHENTKYHLKPMHFEGIQACTEKELQDVMSTKPWNWLSWLKKTGVYKKEQLQYDLEQLTDYYQNNGYLDVQIDPEKIRLEKNEKKLRITIPIEEGDCYSIHAIRLTNDDNLKVEDLIAKTGLKEGDPCSPKAINQACTNLQDFYGRYGYIDAEVQVKRLWFDEKSFDLEFSVTRGIQSKINSIYISGNINTQARVILRETNLAPGDTLDRTRLENAEQRLMNTGLFKSVTILPEDTALPNKKNVKISVEEANTGSIFLSGGINSEEKFTVGVTLTQSNFDYRNKKNYFRGAGQKFQLATRFGKYSNEITLSFEEPWLFDRELRFGFNLFRTVCKYTSDDYHEQAIGGEIYLAKRLFEQVQGKLYYHLEEFELKDVNQANVSTAIWNERGKRSISKIGFTLDRDTRDHFLYPTEGSFLEWDNQLAGGPLMGQTKYMRTRFTAAKWFLLSPEHEQTFLVGGRVGTMRGFGGKEVPLFEREFLGGPDDLRAFDIRDVGPKTNDKFHDPLGGKSFAFSKMEYSMKVHTIVRLVGFFDIGFVNPNTFSWKTSNYNSDIGFGFRIHLLGAPFRLDFAFPLTTDHYNRRKAPQIVYSFGVSF